MTILKTSKFLSLAVAIVAFVSLNVMAQQQGAPPQMPQQAPEVNENFSDEEYEQFVQINTEVIPVQQEAQGKMIKAIEDKGLEVERFQQLAQAQQTGGLQDASDDAEEIAKFNEAGQEVMEMQKGIQEKVQEVIEDNGLGVQKFQEMSMAYNQSEKVRAKVDEMISEKMGDEE